MLAWTIRPMRNRSARAAPTAARSGRCRPRHAPVHAPAAATARPRAGTAETRGRRSSARSTARARGRKACASDPCRLTSTIPKIASPRSASSASSRVLAIAAVIASPRPLLAAMTAKTGKRSREGGPSDRSLRRPDRRRGAWRRAGGDRAAPGQVRRIDRHDRRRARTALRAPAAVEGISGRRQELRPHPDPPAGILGRARRRDAARPHASSRSIRRRIASPPPMAPRSATAV